MALNFFSKLSEKISAVFKKGYREEIWDKLLENLILADTSVEIAENIISTVQNKSQEQKNLTEELIKKLLKDEIANLLSKNFSPPKIVNGELNIYLIIGVNGSGKTTTCAKLANYYLKDNKKVMLAAADTFRAAAIDQLKVWGNRLNLEVIAQKEGSDPASIAYDGTNSALSKNYDLLIIDTAGRLHTKKNLLEELKKITKVINKIKEGLVKEILIVLDATIGQNAFNQAQVFMQEIQASGLILTKLDGTAKGGSILSVNESLALPVKYIGFGETLNDFGLFHPVEFAEMLIGQ